MFFETMQEYINNHKKTMKKSRLVSVATLVFAVSLLTVSSAKADMSDFLDLSGQKATVRDYQVVLDERSITLKVHEYAFIDWDKVEWHYVNILYNEKDQPWLAFYAKNIGEPLPGTRKDAVTKETHYSLFENINGTWTLVMAFLLDEDNYQKLVKLMKEKYKLEAVK